MSIITEALTKAQEKRKNDGHQKIEVKTAEEKIIKIQNGDLGIAKQTKPVEDIKSAFNIKSIVIFGIIIAASVASLKLIPFIHKPAVKNLPKQAAEPQAPQAQAAPQQIPQSKPEPASAPYKFNLSNPLFEFSLEGIISGNGAPVAIINKQLVGVGDEVKGAIVSEIKEDEVILNYNGEELTLQLK